MFNTKINKKIFETMNKKTFKENRLHMNTPQEHSNHPAITNNTMLNVGD